MAGSRFVKVAAAAGATAAVLAGGTPAAGHVPPPPPAAQSAAAATPALRIARVSITRASVRPGRRLTVRVALLRSPAPRSGEVALLLSRDGAPGADDLLVARLRARSHRAREARVQRRVMMPASVAPGAYRIVACGRTARRGAAHCRTSARPLTVAREDGLNDVGPAVSAPPVDVGPAPDQAAEQQPVTLEDGTSLLTHGADGYRPEESLDLASLPALKHLADCRAVAPGVPCIRHCPDHTAGVNGPGRFEYPCRVEYDLSLLRSSRARSRRARAAQFGCPVVPAGCLLGVLVAQTYANLSFTVAQAVARNVEIVSDPPECDGLPGIQVIYAHANNGPNAAAARIPAIRNLINQMNGRLIRDSERSSGGARPAQYRVTCAAFGEVHVDVVRLNNTPATMTDQNAELYRSIVNDVRAQGRTNGDAKYLIFADVTPIEAFCGRGNVAADGRPGTINANNDATADYGVVYTGAGTNEQPNPGNCFNSVTAQHENGHNMGAVQPGDATNPPAPASTTGFHCNAQPFTDVMCYADGSGRSDPASVRCAAPHLPYPYRYDCDADSYFTTSLSPTGYLRDHWNIGATYNRFIIHTG